MKDSGLGGKVVVITGASSGFGKGASLRFAEAGAHLVIAARRTSLLEDLAQQCHAAGTNALAVTTDVSKEQEVADLAARAVHEFGRIDVWINNAGVGALGPFERTPLGEHVQVIGTNLMGTVYGSYFAYRQFLSQGNGILINVASELGRHTVPYYSSYTAAKHGVVGLSDALRQEIDQNGHTSIHVCVVMPTAHEAAKCQLEISAKLVERLADSLSEEDRAKIQTYTNRKLAYAKTIGDLLEKLGPFPTLDY